MATHLDVDKPRLELLPAAALTEWARAMTFGARKYGDHNWRKGMAWTRVVGSLSRHLTAFMAGENQDPESGVNHMAHVMCNAAFLLHYEQHHKELDDRYKSPEPLQFSPQISAQLSPQLSPQPSPQPLQFSPQPHRLYGTPDVTLDLGGIYISPQERFLFTFNPSEYYDAQRDDHWVWVYYRHAPLYLLYDYQELSMISEIYKNA